MAPPGKMAVMTKGASSDVLKLSCVNLLGERAAIVTSLEFDIYAIRKWGWHASRIY